jgi:hypothetical protein
LGDNAACASELSVPLTGGSPAGGTYSGNGVVGNTFYPFITGVGSSMITYTYTDANGCSGFATATMTVNALPNVALILADDMACVSETTLVLAGGTPTGGTYSGTGVVSGNFNPSIAGVGTHTITYSYTDANGCTATATDLMVVSDQPNPQVLSDATYCMGAMAATLDVTSPGATYSWSSGETTACITPSTTTPSTTTYTVTITNGACAATQDATIIVNDCNTASIGDFVWSDLDGDGLQDVGETGIGGILVTLTNPDGSTATTTTNPDGSYIFSNLPEGNYTVTVGVGPAGTTLSTPATDNVTLGVGEVYTTADFGFEPLGSIGDFVWSDLDGDGLQDVGETGIGGILVTLTNPDGTSATTTTNPDGSYIFSNLPEGNYTVTVGVGPAGTTLSTPATDNVTLGVGEVYTTADFGFEPLGSIGDFVWSDLDGDGLQDVGETGIGGILVTLTNPDGSTATTTTNPDGSYIFSNLPAGSYVVSVGVGPAGTTLSTPATDNVTLGVGEVYTAADFGFEPLGSIGDFVWSDLDGDGLQDVGETGIGGILVTLTNPDGSTATTTTNPDGSYLFSNLPEGNYTVTVGVGPAGTTLSTPATDNVTLGVGEVYTTADFGFEPLGSIGDFVWSDLDGDGLQDVGETGIGGILVTLTNPDGTSATTTTKPDGSYIFSNLPEGNYTVTVGVGPAGTTLSTPATDNVTLGVGEVYTTADFGFEPLGSIGDFVWSDLDGDGLQDVGETGIGGILVTLTNPDGTSATTSTNPDGSYIFSNLPAGSYVVSVGVGPAGTTLSTPATDNVTLGVGEVYTTADFGFEPLGSIGDFVWSDLDGDGLQDVGETGIGGILVTLTNPDGTSATTSTNPDGSYIFSNLPAGSYVVSVGVGPAGTTLSTPATDNVTLGVGEVYTAADFGFEPLGSIGDFVWSDLDGDGLQDVGETGIGSIIVTLTNPDGSTGTTTTNPDGSYIFSNLPEGNYTVTVGVGPAGTTLSTPATDNVTLGVGEVYTAADFGFEPLGSIGDFVWSDLDGDGLQDVGETGIGGIIVTLTNPDGSTATTTTNPDGSYIFSNLPEGNYTVTVGVGPAGTTLSTPATDNVTLGVGEVYTTADFGFEPLGSIGDFVWSDLDGDGLQDVGETGIGGILVTLTNPDGTSATTSTNPDGSYLFSGLSIGSYVVSVGVGPAGTTLSTPISYSVALAPDQDYWTADFGFEPTSALGNYVWSDLSGDGQQNDGAVSGLNGVTAILYADANADGLPDGTAWGSTITTNDILGNPGYYQFTNVPAGSYVIQFVAPSGYGYTTTQNGGAISSSSNTSDSDSNVASAATGYTGTITLGVAETINTIDAGLVLLSVCEANAGDIPQVELCEGSYPTTNPMNWTPEPLFDGTYGPAPTPATDYSFQYFITNDVPAPHTIQVVVAENTNPDAAIINALTPGVYRLYRVSWKSGGTGSGLLQDASGSTVNVGDNVEALTTSAIVDCIDLTYTYVTILSNPIAGASSNSPLCDTRDILLIGSGGTSYAWSGPLGFSSTEQNPSILSNSATFPGPGSWTYYVTVTNGACSATSSTLVVVNDSPDIAISANSPLCAGSTLTLTSNYTNPTNSDVYQWSGSLGFTSALPNPSIANVSTQNAGTYTLLVANEYGCTSAATVIATVNPTPNTVILSNTTCSGGLANLSLSVPNAGLGASYAWSGTGVGTGNSQTVNGLSAGSQTYSVTVTNNLGCTASNTTTVAIPSCFVCNAQAGTVLVNSGCIDEPITATISGNTTGSGFTTQFIVANSTGTIVYVGSSPIPAQPAGSYTVYSYNYSSAPTPAPAIGMAIAPYTFGSISGGCYDVSDNGTAMTIYNGSPALVSLVNVEEGNTGGISPFYYTIDEVLVEGGSTPYNFTWDNSGYVRYDIQYGDHDGDGIEDAFITIYYADNAVWACTITDDVICGNSDELTFTNVPGVTTNPILDIDDYVITPETSTNGNGAITIYVSGGTPCAAPNSYTYQWAGPTTWTGAAAASGSGGATETVTGLPWGWYSVTVTDCSGQTTEGWYWVPRSRRGRSKVEEATMNISAMPNPFISSTTIEFQTAQDATATVEVYAVDGKRVATLYNDLVVADELYSVQLSADNLPAGVYNVVLSTDKGERSTYKLLLTK